MAGATTPAAGVQRTMLDDRSAKPLGQEIVSGTYATVHLASRTREQISMADIVGDTFRLLRQVGMEWQLSTGPAERLATELVSLPGELEVTTGTPQTTEPRPYDASVRPLASGEWLALAEEVRRGDQHRITAACEQLGLAGVPSWITEIAWGAEGTLTMMQISADTPRYASLLHLLASGWGVLANDENDDFTFRPLTSLEVQARLSDFATLLLLESSDDD